MTTQNTPTREGYEAALRLLAEQQKSLQIAKQILRRMRKGSDVSTIDVFLEHLKPLFAEFKRLRTVTTRVRR